MPARRLVLPTACASLALSGCNHAPTPVTHAPPAKPATLETVDWEARQPVYIIGERERDAQRLAEEAANEQARAALQVKASPSFDGVTFLSVLDYMEEVTGIKIVTNWPALELSGIDQESLVTLDLTDVSAERILQLALDQVSAAAFDDERAGYEVVAGFVNVTTRADLRTYTEVRVYDIRDLLMGPALRASMYHGRPDAEAIVAILETQGEWWLNEAPEFDLNDALG